MQSGMTRNGTSDDGYKYIDYLAGSIYSYNPITDYGHIYHFWLYLNSERYRVTDISIVKRYIRHWHRDQYDLASSDM
ncbi:hypothetical protein KJ359_005079 [Pestalotiopsis sp. 9143b]|nr:hypothetical protein KJ359_005079 [Pestalotiopsis sp. 9143b]